MKHHLARLCVLSLSLAVVGGGIAFASMTSTPAAPRTRTASADVGDNGAPSPSSRMVCSQEIRQDVAVALGLRTPPPTTATWSDHVFTCTHHAAGGPLVFSVTESVDVPAARTYMAGLEKRLAPTSPLNGATDLGLPAFETANGTVVFLKDDKTLQVDATAMPALIGPGHESRTAFAYQMASAVLGCWTGD